ncbi:MAG: hypothetical protein ABI165_11295, partial [Bryobacteraceae bacterium]
MIYRALFLCAVLLPLQAGQLILPGKALERDRPVVVTYRFARQGTGKGELSVNWTDALGRVVEDRQQPFVLTDETDVRFPLDLRRAVSMANTLTVHAAFDGVDKKGAPDRRDERESAAFTAKPREHGWRDYQII